jgi:hypothetical protein
MRGGGPLKKRPRSPPSHEDGNFEPVHPSKLRRTTMTEYFAGKQGGSSAEHTQSTTSTSSSSCGTSEEGSSDCETEEASSKLLSVTDDKLSLSRERNRVHAQVSGLQCSRRLLQRIVQFEQQKSSKTALKSSKTVLSTSLTHT